MSIETLIAIIVLVGLYGFCLGYGIPEYKHAGKELKRIREGFEADKKWYQSKTGNA